MINWIAEIGSNHNQDVLRMKRLIIESKKAGFTHVKLQKFNGKKLIHGQDKSNIELSDELFLEAVKFATAQDIKIGCSVFDIESLNFVAPYVDFLKISSFDVEREDLISACLHKRKHVIISYGMNNINEINKHIFEHPIYTIPMICISKYPTQLNECRMGRYDKIEKYTNQKIGWSDHTVSEIAILTAISKGATWIETHVDLDDMQGAESHHGHVWPMAKIGKLISDYNDCCRYDDEFEGDRMNMADPEDGMRPPKELR